MRQPTFLATATFNNWLAHALTDGQHGQYVNDCATVNEYARRCNREVASLVAADGEEAINKAIWYIYGSVSGYMWDAMHSSLNRDAFSNRIPRTSPMRYPICL